MFNKTLSVLALSYVLITIGSALAAENDESGRDPGQGGRQRVGAAVPATIPAAVPAQPQEHAPRRPGQIPSGVYYSVLSRIPDTLYGENGPIDNLSIRFVAGKLLTQNELTADPSGHTAGVAEQNGIIQAKIKEVPSVLLRQDKFSSQYARLQDSSPAPFLNVFFPLKSYNAAEPLLETLKRDGIVLYMTGTTTMPDPKYPNSQILGRLILFSAAFPKITGLDDITDKDVVEMNFSLERIEDNMPVVSIVVRVNDNEVYRLEKSENCVNYSVDK